MTNRKKIIAGNWKMFTVPSESQILAEDIIKRLEETNQSEIIIFPPYVSLDRVNKAILNSSLHLGAQDLHWETQGAITGKISGDMLSNIGVSHVIIGHSEQRVYFHESDQTVNKKIKAALTHKLIPVICVGETKEERNEKKVEEIIFKQLRLAFQGLSAIEANACIIAYEPVWAIGTGITATPQQVQEVHSYIRKSYSQIYDETGAIKSHILYGGSLKPENAKELLSCQDVDGGLIGGASLNASAFCEIVHISNQI